MRQPVGERDFPVSVGFENLRETYHAILVLLFGVIEDRWNTN
jgi:hypothetical protein